MRLTTLSGFEGNTNNKSLPAVARVGAIPCWARAMRDPRDTFQGCDGAIGLETLRVNTPQAPTAVRVPARGGAGGIYRPQAWVPAAPVRSADGGRGAGTFSTPPPPGGKSPGQKGDRAPFGGWVVGLEKAGGIWLPGWASTKAPGREGEAREEPPWGYMQPSCPQAPPPRKKTPLPSHRGGGCEHFTSNYYPLPSPSPQNLKILEQVGENFPFVRSLTAFIVQ